VSKCKLWKTLVVITGPVQLCTCWLTAPQRASLRRKASRKARYAWWRRPLGGAAARRCAAALAAAAASSASYRSTRTAGRSGTPSWHLPAGWIRCLEGRSLSRHNKSAEAPSCRLSLTVGRKLDAGLGERKPVLQEHRFYQIP
jgi:hypothetical protein